MTDRTILTNACFYCGRPASDRWPSGRLTCSHELCKSLAHAHEKGPARELAAPTTAWARRPRR